MDNITHSNAPFVRYFFYFFPSLPFNTSAKRKLMFHCSGVYFKAMWESLMLYNFRQVVLSGEDTWTVVLFLVFKFSRFIIFIDLEHSKIKPCSQIATAKVYK